MKFIVLVAFIAVAICAVSSEHIEYIKPADADLTFLETRVCKVDEAGKVAARAACAIACETFNAKWNFGKCFFEDKKEDSTCKCGVVIEKKT